MGSRARPTSASSRTAWGDYGSARPDSQFDFGQDGIRDDPDLSPNDNDSVYNGPGAKPKSSTAVATTGGKKSTSFFGKIGKGIRSLWATRQTEDVKGDRELHVKTTLRELIVYIVFLVILCIITFGMTSTTMYYYTKVMSDLFLDTTWTGGGSFRTITSVEDFWKFAKGPLMKGLYWETWYNNQSVPDDQLGYIYYENKLLGVPRLRQLQVHSNSCTVHDDFKDVIRECYESYAESLENKEPFGLKDNYTGWYYRSEDDLDGSSHWGLIATYSGAGYVQDLYRNKSQSEAVIEYLFNNRWIQRGTRIVFIDFTVYNANINLFCVVRLTVEFPPTGGAIPHATMRTVKLIRYVTVMDYFIMACEFIFCLFIIYYMIEEAIEIKKHKFAYFKNFWNILDIVVIVIALVCVAFNIYRLIKVNDLLSELLNKPDEYADFVFLGYGQTQFDNAIAIAVFFAWIKIFKYISFNKTMTQLSSTLGKCAKDLAGFAVMFFIIFLAFTQLGYLLFGTQVKDFSNFQNSFFTLFRIILGDFDFDQLEAANRVLGPIFFMLFVFFVFFVLINMFLAIINDTYSEVKGDMANQKNEFEMTDYFKRGYEKMISKLNFKHDKIVDIQKALHSADMNNDKQVDFDEWRHDLKTRGYADGEIEALFAKYDVDGDRVLDEEEQKRMQADLNDQKAALNKEYDELEKMNRPESAHRSTSRASINDGSGSDSDDEDSRTKSSRSGPSQSVSYEEFTVLSRRVDRMEHSIGSIVSKIDAVLVKLELMEKAKLKRRETMGKILDSITESDGTSDEVKREQMERLVREELERWDSESSITPPSGRGASPGSGIRGGARPRSRPDSGGNSDPEEEIDLPEFDRKSEDDSESDSGDIAISVDSSKVSKQSVLGVGNANKSVSGNNRTETNTDQLGYLENANPAYGLSEENDNKNLLQSSHLNRKFVESQEKSIGKPFGVGSKLNDEYDGITSAEKENNCSNSPAKTILMCEKKMQSSQLKGDIENVKVINDDEFAREVSTVISQPNKALKAIGTTECGQIEDNTNKKPATTNVDIDKQFRYPVLAPIDKKVMFTPPLESKIQQTNSQNTIDISSKDFYPFLQSKRPSSAKFSVIPISITHTEIPKSVTDSDKLFEKDIEIEPSLFAMSNVPSEIRETVQNSQTPALSDAAAVKFKGDGNECKSIAMGYDLNKYSDDQQSNTDKASKSSFNKTLNNNKAVILLEKEIDHDSFVEQDATKINNRNREMNERKQEIREKTVCVHKTDKDSWSVQNGKQDNNFQKSNDYNSDMNSSLDETKNKSIPPFDSGDPSFNGLNVLNEKGCNECDLEKYSHIDLENEIVNAEKKRMRKKSSGEKKNDTKVRKQKGRSVTTARGQKVTLGTLAMKSSGKIDSDKDNTTHEGAVIPTDDDQFHGQTKRENYLEKDHEQSHLPKIQSLRSKQQHANRPVHSVNAQGKMVPKRETFPLPVIPIGKLSLSPDTDAAHKVLDGDSGSNRNQISTHSSCKTPVMEKVSTTVFV